MQDRARGKYVDPWILGKVARRTEDTGEEARQQPGTRADAPLPRDHAVPKHQSVGPVRRLGRVHLGDGMFGRNQQTASRMQSAAPSRLRTSREQVADKPGDCMQSPTKLAPAALAPRVKLGDGIVPDRAHQHASQGCEHPLHAVFEQIGCNTHIS